MKLDTKTKRNVRLQSVLFYLLLSIVIILLAQLSIKHVYHVDFTANNRHSLSPTTTTFLEQLKTPVTIQAFISPNSEYLTALQALLTRYQRYSDQLSVNYIDPDFSPQLVRQFNIQQQGEMVITRGQLQQHVYDLSEQSLTNALITVSREKEQWLVFVEGHGERTPLHQANFNLATWGENLKKKGFKLQSINLVEQSYIPDNTAVLVIASPEKPWLNGEIDLVKEFISNGGQLLWLTEPGTTDLLMPLAEQLGIAFVPGTVMDPNSELLGINDPRFTLITDYAHHPVAEAMSTVSLFPQSVALDQNDAKSDWQYLSLLNTADNVWSELDPVPSQSILPNTFNFDSGTDIPGPLTLAYLITKPFMKDDDNGREQRIAVIGDGDFLSNTYIGNGANLELGMALVNWLAEDDELITIPIKTTLDKQLELTQSQSLYIGLGFLVALPLSLFSIGLFIWWHRRRQ